MHLKFVIVALNKDIFNTANRARSWNYRREMTTICYCYTQSAELIGQVVCPSVMLRYREHIGWNSSKVISLSADPKSRI